MRLASLMGALPLLAVVACVGTGTPVPDSLPAGYVPGATPGTGIVIGSVTSMPDPDLKWQEFSQYYFEKRDDPGIFGTLRSGSDDDYGKLIIPFAYKRYPPGYDGCALDGLKAECGRLFAIQLPAGDYAIKSIDSPVLDDGSSFWHRPAQAPADYLFSVGAGEIVYVGNFNSRICVGYIKVIGYGHVIIAASGEVQDQFDRDWPLLLEKYPFLADRTIQRRVISAAPWRIRRGEHKREPWVPEYGWDGCDREARESGWPGLAEEKSG